MSIDNGFFSDCYFHRVCGGLVIPGEDVCQACRSEWGQLLRKADVSDDSAPESQFGQQGALRIVERQQQQQAGQTPKANQVCWLCERRRSCLRAAGGWECSDCLGVV